MKFLTQISFALYFSGLAASGAQAQNIVVAIPTNATVVSNGALGSDNDRTYWLCNAGQVRVSGNNNTVYVDNQSQVIVEGNNTLIYSISQLPITIRGNNTTVYTNGASVSSTGNNNTVYAPFTANINLNGNDNQRSLIETLQFTYFLAPNTPCRVTTSIADGRSQNIYVAPNPVSGSETLRLIGLTSNNVQLVMVDATGKQVARNTEGESTLSLSKIRPGIYRVLVTQAGQVASLPVVVQ